ADQADVGDDLQFQHQPALLAGLAGLDLARGAVGGAGEVLVAVAAAPAAGHDHLLARPGEVAQDVAPVAVEHEGAGRHGDDEVVAVAAWAVAAAAGGAAGGPPVLAVDDVGQAVGAGHGAHDHGAAVAAVAAVGAAARHVLLAAEAQAA